MKAYSIDLRERVIGSIKKGRAQTWVAREMGIGLGTVKRYIKLEQTTGSLEPKCQQREQPKISNAELPVLQAQVDSHPDATIEEHIEYWASSHGVRVGQATMCRPYSGQTDRLKKTVRAQERDEGERVLFQDLASTVAVKRLVVIDESGTKIGMTPACSRAPSGERAYSTTPFNSGSNYTLLAALRLSGMSAPLVIEGAADSAVFEAYIRDVLGPTLLPRDLVVMDNVRFHKATAIEPLILQRGASILWLPPYSPDLSPIEHAFSKLKQFLRRAKTTTFDALLNAIADGLEAISSSDALAWFINCGYFNIDHAT